MTREDDKALKFGKEDPANVKTDKSNKAAAAVVEETEFKKPVVGSKERNIDLQLDLEKTDRDSGNAGFSGNKLHQHVTKQQQNTEKSGMLICISLSLPLPLSFLGLICLGCSFNDFVILSATQHCTFANFCGCWLARRAFSNGV